ncbi:MAG TPA: CAP domain-containing protein [Blastococcus sp.]|nr:CAP domain-containing protein [Blastococcus sp.]
MHHAPAGPPTSARIRGAVTRSSLHARAAARTGLRHRSGRLALGVMVSTVITALVLAVPVGSGSDGTARSVTFSSTAATAASSSASSSADSPVVMGRDGRPVSSSTFAGSATSTAAASRTGASSSSTSGSSSSSDSSEPTEDAVVAAPGTPGSAASSPSSGPAPAPAGGTSSSGSTAAGSPAPGPGSPDPSLPVEEPPAVEPSTEAGSPAAAGDRVLALVNGARVGAGCAALVVDGGLAATAKAHSTDMRKDGVLGLRTADGGSVLALGARAASVASGTTDPGTVVDSWLAGGDGAAILDCGMTAAGIGMDRGNAGPWWTLLLA